MAITATLLSRQFVGTQEVLTYKLVCDAVANGTISNVPMRIAKDAAGTAITTGFANGESINTIVRGVHTDSATVTQGASTTRYVQIFSDNIVI